MGPEAPPRPGKELNSRKAFAILPDARLANKPACGSGRSVVWYARLLGVQEVVSSNLTAPTIDPHADASLAQW